MLPGCQGYKPESAPTRRDSQLVAETFFRPEFFGGFSIRGDGCGALT
jgi:hypothetical protein